MKARIWKDRVSGKWVYRVRTATAVITGECPAWETALLDALAVLGSQCRAVRM